MSNLTFILSAVPIFLGLNCLWAQLSAGSIVGAQLSWAQLSVHGFTVGMVLFMSYAVPPLRPKRSILHSFRHKIFLTKPSSLFKCVFANSSLDFKCVFFNKAVLRGLRDFRFCPWSSLLIALLQMLVPFLLRSVCIAPVVWQKDHS